MSFALPLVLWVTAANAAGMQDSLCRAHTTHADPSLNCLPLHPTDRAPEASGTAVLRPEPGPFGLSVTRDGKARFRVVLTVSGLPPAETLGPYRRFVAWATTPDLSPMISLGPLRNGRTSLGPIALERFLILISVEASAGPQPKGPFVLRGSSPSLFMAPHGVTDLPPAGHAAQGHATHRWSMPPMHRSASRMPYGLERFSPGVNPFLPTFPDSSARITSAPEVYAVADGDTITITAGKTVRKLNGRSVVGYAYNGRVPGPRIEIVQGGTVTVRFRNETDLPSSIHWHGLRLANASDGVPGLTQPLVPPGGEFVYRVYAPDPGLFWYHPHHREDIAQDLGLAGNFVVRPRNGAGGSLSEAFLMLDDALLGDSGLVPFGHEAPTHALMGRFGNVLLVNGRNKWELDIRPNQRIRLYLTNAANARTFNVSLDGAVLRVIEADAGPFGKPRDVESIVIAPAERYVVEAHFQTAGQYALVNRVRAIDRVTGRFFAEVDTLGMVSVRGPSGGLEETSAVPGRDTLPAVMQRLQGRKPDRVLQLTLRTQGLPFALVQALRLDTSYVHPVEWTSPMPMMDWLSTGRDVTWIIRDSLTGAEGMALDWRVPRGRPLVVRLINDKHVLHPMGHPIHLHGQRFLVLSRNGVANRDPAWKDTVLVPAGGTVDLLVDTNNPGRWMLHCHIAEHLESGMHTVLTVEDGKGGKDGKDGRDGRGWNGQH